MPDDKADEMSGAPVFDDDRLLALALGLDDDSELEAAAAADEGLRRRLDAVRAEVEQLGAQVRASVPDPGADYAEPGAARWAGLQEFFAAARPARRRRASRWLRVLAPAAVALVAVAVGLAVINDQKSGTVGISSSLPSAAKATGEAAGSQSGAVGARVTDRAAQSLYEQIDQFAVVVLARAQAATGAFQRFVVVRVLKGAGPDSVRLRVADRPVDVGRLNVLFLRPQPPTYVGPSTEATLTPLPSATETTSTLGALASATPVAYSYGGQTAVLRQLPAGTDPYSLTLP
jgi:hypothetical protein